MRTWVCDTVGEKPPLHGGTVVLTDGTEATWPCQGTAQWTRYVKAPNMQPQPILMRKPCLCECHGKKA